MYSAVILLAMTLSAQTPKYGVGRTPSDEEVRSLGVRVAPDGKGLPEGSGSVAEGRALFAQRCAKCHGDKAEGDIGPALVGGQGTLATAKPKKTVGSFWPYAPVVWDYIHRAMPFNEPGSLNYSQAYAATAYVLFLNGLVQEKDVMDAKSLPKIRMPNRDGFVPDPRPDVGKKPSAAMTFPDFVWGRSQICEAVSRPPLPAGITSSEKGGIWRSRRSSGELPYLQINCEAGSPKKRYFTTTLTSRFGTTITFRISLPAMFS